jgi:hypothetical protein
MVGVQGDIGMAAAVRCRHDAQKLSADCSISVLHYSHEIFGGEDMALLIYQQPVSNDEFVIGRIKLGRVSGGYLLRP